MQFSEKMESNEHLILLFLDKHIVNELLLLSVLERFMKIQFLGEAKTLMRSNDYISFFSLFSFVNNNSVFQNNGGDLWFFFFGYILSKDGRFKPWTFWLETFENTIWPVGGWHIAFKYYKTINIERRRVLFLSMVPCENYKEEY